MDWNTPRFGESLQPQSLAARGDAASITRNQLPQLRRRREHERMGSKRLQFTAELQPQRRGWLGVQLPAGSAAALGTRGQVRVRLTINGVSFETLAFPDGGGGHVVWVRAPLRRRLGLERGQRIEVMVERAPQRPRVPVRTNCRRNSRVRVRLSSRGTG
jgi:Domain of unknown function (DUF1905)